ncbi:ankyrin repeat and fibronectin type-III domain-containing protein 1 [Clonorchis sinensis]|uniref:Ankyrin repeat and fibronectin type-III domain-containing protein 1 n=1 Tax=Clonorchis sinensis TaxID=79923 RepID=H2KU49_CLOSI|nr:ankyrin repeat and fibronectin type-III domain-containing protein 1 [Clonorchis sinensis]
MLTSALNFLTDKRKRFNRSDTVPVFSIDNDVEKGILSEQVAQDVRTFDDSELDTGGRNITQGKSITNSASMLKLPSQPVYFIDGDQDVNLTNQVIESSRSGTVWDTAKRKQTAQKNNLEVNAEKMLSTVEDFDPNISSAVRDENAYQAVVFQKHAQQTVRYYSPDGQLSDELRTKPNETNVKRSHSNISKPSDSKGTVTVTQPASCSKNRTARLRSRVTKSKLQRSRSSAQISRSSASTEVTYPKTNHTRSTSNQRDPTVGPYTEVREESGSESKQRSRKRGRNWIDRGRRSRSVNVLGKSPSPCMGVHKDLYDLLSRIAGRGTSDKFYRIRVPDFPVMPSATRPARHLPKKELHDAGIVSTQTSSENIMGPAELALTGAALLGCSNASGAHSKLNRYAVVRRLRRNNSTINWPPSRQTVDCDPSQCEPTSQNAGDLLLPSRTKTVSHGEHTPVSPELYHTLKEVFSYVEQNELEYMLKEFKKIYSLSVELKLGKHNQCNAFGLSLLDISLLVSSLEMTLYLMALDFQLGPELNDPLTNIPTCILGRDPLKYHLARCVGETEVHLVSLKNEVKVLISKSNELGRPNLAGSAEDINNAGVSDLSLTRTSLFSEIAEKERQIAEQEDNRKYLAKLHDGLNRFPLFPPSPTKVVLMVSSPNSILIRITPPRVTNITRHSVDHTAEEDRTDSLEDTTSCESSTEEFSEGRRITCADSYGNFILRYRIEWSSSVEFDEKETAYCIVEPPVRLDKLFNSDSTPSSRYFKSSLFRTGFYELTDLQPDKFIFVRVYSYSVRGWSEPCYAKPRCIRPSSWFEALPITSKSTESTDSSEVPTAAGHEGVVAPLRYVGNSLSEEFRSVKQLLDQQIFLWVHKPSNLSGTEGSSPINDDGLKRTKSPMIQRKRSFRFPFTSKSIKFVKQTKTGVYLALLCHTDFQMDDLDGEKGSKCQIVTVDDCLPMICVTREEIASASSFYSDISWFSRLVADPSIGPDLQLINEHILRIPTPNNLQLRYHLLDALTKLQVALGSCNVGSVYPELFRGKMLDLSITTPTQQTSATTTTAPIESTESISADEPSDSVPSQNSTQPDLTTPHSSSSILVLVRHVRNLSDTSLSSGMRWIPLHKFLRQNKVNAENFCPLGLDSEPGSKIQACETDKEGKPVCRTEPMTLSPEANLLMRLDSLMQYSSASNQRLPPGLYVTFVQMQARLNQQANILVSKASDTPFMLPTERVRKRSHVTCAEWTALCQLQNTKDENRAAYHEDLSHSGDHKYRFVKQLYRASTRLVRRLQVSEEESEQLRIYLPEVVRISPQHSLILLFPAADQVCLPPTSSIVSPLPTCAWCSMAFFERNLGMTYDPIYHCRISSLLAILDLLVPLSVFVQRQCISDTEWSQNSDRTSALQSIQQQIESLFSGKRWLSEAIGTARDRKRSTQPATTLLSNLRFFSEPPLLAPRALARNSKLFQSTGSLDEMFPSGGPLNSATIGPVNRYTTASSSQDVQSAMDSRSRDINRVLSGISRGMHESRVGDKSAPSSTSSDKPSHILRVYAEYPTGLASGTSVRIKVGLKTTAKSIARVVVEKLAETAQRTQCRKVSDRPVDSGLLPVEQTTKQYCLIVSVGETERCLPETFRPLLLQQPWRDGRFSVRSLEDWNSKISPTRTYLVAEQILPTSSCENLTFIQTTFRPLRPARAKLIQVAAEFFHAKIRPPLTVYLDGRPVTTVPK